MTRTKDQAAAVLPTMLKALRLPSINRNWKRLTDTADRDGWPAVQLLASLLEIERRVLSPDEVGLVTPVLLLHKQAIARVLHALILVDDEQLIEQ